MQALSFNVLSARQTPSGSQLHVAYTERDNPYPVLFTYISCAELERYLQCLHDVHCPDLQFWITHTAPAMIWIRIAQFVEHQMSQQAEALQIPIDYDQLQYLRS